MSARLTERFVCITDRTLVPGHDLPRALERVCAAWPPGALLVQLREKDLSGRALWELAQAVRLVTARHGARLVVNERADVALSVGADGVHLPEAGLPAATARALLGPQALVGVSVHCSDAAARHPDASYVTLSPIWESPGKGPPLGVAALEATRAGLGSRGPALVALGGIETGARAQRALVHGASAVAGVRAFLASDAGRSLAEDRAEARAAHIDALGVLAGIVREARTLVVRPDSDFTYCYWGSAEAATTVLDGLLLELQRGRVDRLELEVLFALTGPMQELAMSSGWAEAYLRLAERFDRAIALVLTLADVAPHDAGPRGGA